MLTITGQHALAYVRRNDPAMHQHLKATHPSKEPVPGPIPVARHKKDFQALRRNTNVPTQHSDLNTIASFGCAAYAFLKYWIR
ncbi:hypothetical protein ABVK25_001567 [Lepraria finkii]|uniref:Uncharacterized protein n=1 Tax=Lepraria finkii TaxID=1340010 RepID=A0ABR4BJF5_9LECA